MNLGQLCFTGKAQICSKLLISKKYIQYSEKFQGKLCFQGKAQVVKNPECEKYIQYSENFRATDFSGQAQVAQKS